MTLPLGRVLDGHVSGHTSVNSSAMNTPIPSRSGSPLPQFYSSAASSPSDTDSEEPAAPFLAESYAGTYLREGQPRWWQFGQRRRGRRRPRRRAGWGPWSLARALRRLCRHRFIPKQPSTIEPLPWRAYCTMPELLTDPPPLHAHPTFLNVSTVADAPPYPPFPPSNFDALPPAGVFVGVFSMDSSFERRMLIRTTWASHARSRNGAGAGDGGDGTSRTIVRFILGQPRKSWERRVRLEMERYNDIVLLPVPENMNSGKTYTFFTWAATMAWLLVRERDNPPPVLAAHDPLLAWLERAAKPNAPQDWVRPDFVVKADDDSFIMLAELEARLRIALHDARRPAPAVGVQHPDHTPPLARAEPPPPASSSQTEPLPPLDERARPALPPPLNNDPLIYWGYLVKRRFMAGETYALSWGLAEWVATDAGVKGLTRGAEDKQTAKWMRLHPRARDVRWTAERCWIYDHPRSGTVYSHGFLFPSEAVRVRQGVRAFFDRPPLRSAQAASASVQGGMGGDWGAPMEWARSTVSTFGTRYSLPLPDLTVPQSVEALVEGSDMSALHEGSVFTAEDAWRRREGRLKQYGGQRLGGTVVVHFIKQHMWFLETALALLDGADETEYEEQRRLRGEQARAGGVHRPAVVERVMRASGTGAHGS
ncbi:hypothetical protein BC834DRAFT_850978 [Gloeopeniophorella convolvens]|nr:hypothetical protein BC834DRAFT_850978 [Gloeopeniophorella convolvens]